MPAVGSEDGSGSVEERKERKDKSKTGVKRRVEGRPSGWKNAKQQPAMEEHHKKKLRMTKEAIQLQKRHVEVLKLQNDIQMFTQGPGSARPKMARQYLAMKQKMRLPAMKTGMEKDRNQEGLDVLATMVLEKD